MAAVAVSETRRGWLSDAQHVPSPNFDVRPNDVDIDLLVIHAISLPPGQFGGPHIEQLFTNRLLTDQHPSFAALQHLRVSAHFLITRDGRLLQFVDIFARAWHAGESRWQGRSRCNDFSLGVELEGCDELPFEVAQYARLTCLLKDLFQRLPALNATRLVGHSDIAPTRKTDPGPHFDWSQVRKALTQ